MAHCPKCGKKLKLTDLSQFCPACGVNMRFVNFEENFYREAKLAELSQANMHVKIKRLKASFVGSKLTIVRLVVMLLPLLSLLLPTGSFSLSLPFVSKTTQFGALGLYALFTGSDLQYIMDMKGIEGYAAYFGPLFIALIAYVAVAVFAVLVLLLTILCFISIKNMQKVIVAVSGCGIAACVAAMILIGRFCKAVEGFAMLSGKNGFGVLLTIVMFAVVIVLNLIIDKKGIPVEYGEGMPERVAIYKKVRKGEVNIDDLPQPVVETEETRKIDEEIAKEEENYRKKHGKEAAING